MKNPWGTLFVMGLFGAASVAGAPRQPTPAPILINTTLPPSLIPTPVYPPPPPPTPTTWTGRLVFMTTTGASVAFPYSFTGDPIEFTNYKNELIAKYRAQGFIFLYEEAG